MDKWIKKFVEKYNEMILENLSLDVIRSFHYIKFKHLPQGFRHFVSDHLFYYEKMTTKTLDDSHFNFMLVYRSTPFRFNVDFYLGNVFIGVLNGRECDYIELGKYSISDFLFYFISGQELEEIHSQDDQSEIPF